MVIATCDSCNTLVSLEPNEVQKSSLEGREGVSRRVASCEEHAYHCTQLVLPEDAFDYWYDKVQPQQHVYLPSNPNDAVDHCLRCIPQVMETADALLANPPRQFSENERILYVAQGEVAHAVPSQCDVLVSDKSTTCHILALRSTSLQTEVPLTSLTHIDGTCYEECIRAMILEHKHHHHSSGVEEEKKSDDDYSDDRIEMDIHLMGGFEDVKGSSRDISNFLIRLLAQVADEESNSMKFTLQTCAISSMNDSGRSCPIGRGLGIDLKTGKTFLAKVDASLAGPAQDLRSVRLWMGIKQLSVIHTAHSNDIIIEPFHFQPFPELEMLLKLPDDVLLQCTSTSPDVEEEDFCDSVRRSLRFIRQHQSNDIFGSPLLFRRDSFNRWKRRS